MQPATSTLEPQEMTGNTRDIKANLDAVQGRLDQALARAGRNPGACKVVAVTKRQTEAKIEAALAAGEFQRGFPDYHAPAALFGGAR